ncbi:MAG: SUMF1/EgtB/PvdO family nonheme iron enzyme [Deltaproteobacteria bacterium]|nr:SUMF1/EgtB/PvdO family nonheme iron enzyme [Deltaproteobacteria bacterium]
MLSRRSGLASVGLVLGVLVAWGGIAQTANVDRSPRRSVVDPRAHTVCPEDMLHVAGRHCPEPDEECLQWTQDERRQCLRFAPPGRCRVATRPMSFCMDRYEWPNQEGALPSVMVSFEEAERLCAARGRRLCNEDEWAFACAGEQSLPYPYGTERSQTACTIDLLARAPNKVLLHGRDGARREAEVERVYLATPSGSRPLCRSPFAVMDLTGNVDEWVESTHEGSRRSVLMGGFWGHVRNRCRAVTRAHGPTFRYYQIGFRCCDRANPTR